MTRLYYFVHIVEALLIRSKMTKHLRQRFYLRLKLENKHRGIRDVTTVLLTSRSREILFGPSFMILPYKAFALDS